MMKKRKREATASGFCDLPENVVAEIMSWLPPERLVQCKCVQKSWHSVVDSLIKTPWFVAKHLQNSGSRSSSLFLAGDWMSPRTHPTPHCFITDNQLVTSYNVCDEKDEIQFNTQLLTRTTRPAFVEGFYHTSHCHGIIFQTENETNKIMLCNPTTREFKHLDPNSSCFSGSEFKTFVSGFGYDVVDNVYKIVRVVSLPSSSGGGDNKTASYGAEVCTLGLGSNRGDPCSWREIRMINIGNYFKTYTGSGVYHRGFFYWQLRHEIIGSPHERMIISFDIHAEEFRIVPLPSGVVDNPMEIVTESQDTDGQHIVTRVKMGLWFGVWNQRLTLLKYVNVTNPWEAIVPRPVEMWTMKKEERFSRWVKHETFYPPLERFQPTAFWNSDELLLLTCKPGHLASYNLSTQKLTTVRLHPPTAFFLLSAFRYVKSLVSLNHYSS